MATPITSRVIDNILEIKDIISKGLPEQSKDLFVRMEIHPVSGSLIMNIATVLISSLTDMAVEFPICDANIIISEMESFRRIGIIQQKLAGFLKDIRNLNKYRTAISSYSSFTTSFAFTDNNGSVQKNIGSGITLSSREVLHLIAELNILLSRL